MKILLTGATGFVGGVVLRHLLEHPEITRVTCLTRRPLGVEARKLSVIEHGDFTCYDDSLLAGRSSLELGRASSMGQFTQRQWAILRGVPAGSKGGPSSGQAPPLRKAAGGTGPREGSARLSLVGAEGRGSIRLDTPGVAGHLRGSTGRCLGSSVHGALEWPRCRIQRGHAWGSELAGLARPRDVG